MSEGGTSTGGTILHRLSEAIRQQNWFAVLLEFLIVASGVLMGIQVSNWNADRQEQRDIDDLLSRLEPRVREGVYAGPVYADYYRSRMALAEKTEQLWMDGSDDAELVKAAYLTGSYAVLSDFDRSAFELKIGAEVVTQLEDEDLRNAVADLIEVQSDPYMAFAYIDTDFRKIVRRIYPIEVSALIADTCNPFFDDSNVMEALENIRAATTVECDLELDPGVVSVLASALRQHPTALGELREHRNRLDTAISRIIDIGPANEAVLEALGSEAKLPTAPETTP